MKRRHGTLYCCISLAFICALSIISGAQYWQTVVAGAMCFAILSLSLDLQWGVAGIVNLGAALPFGIGAYCVTLSYSMNGSVIPGVFVGVTLAAAISMVIAWGALRAEGGVSRFGLAMLGLTLCVEQFLVIDPWGITGGSNGLLGPRMKDVISLGDRGEEHILPVFVAFVTVVAIGLLWIGGVLMRSWLGSVVLHVRDEPEKLLVYGVNTAIVRTGVVASGGVLGAVAGSLYVMSHGISHPSQFGAGLSVMVLAWVAVGGRGTLAGPMVAAVFLKIIQAELGSQFDKVYMLAVGLMLCGVIVWYPAGLAGAIPMLRARGRC